jgi:hypothetical protein
VFVKTNPAGRKSGAQQFGGFASEWAEELLLAQVSRTGNPGLDFGSCL